MTAIVIASDPRVVQLDEPARLYGFPRNRFVADFIGTINLLTARIKEVHHNYLLLEVTGLGDVAAPLAAGAKVGNGGALALRPEQIRIAARGGAHELKNHFHGTVRSLLYLGDVTVYKVELENGVVLEALLANSAPGRAIFFKAGDGVSIAWRHDAGLYLCE